MSLNFQANDVNMANISSCIIVVVITLQVTAFIALHTCLIAYQVVLITTVKHDFIYTIV